MASAHDAPTLPSTGGGGGGGGGGGDDDTRPSQSETEQFFVDLNTCEYNADVRDSDKLRRLLADAPDVIRRIVSCPAHDNAACARYLHAIENWNAYDPKRHDLKWFKKWIAFYESRLVPTFPPFSLAAIGMQHERPGRSVNGVRQFMQTAFSRFAAHEHARKVAPISALGIPAFKVVPVSRCLPRYNIDHRFTLVPAAAADAAIKWRSIHVSAYFDLNSNMIRLGLELPGRHTLSLDWVNNNPALTVVPQKIALWRLFRYVLGCTPGAVLDAWLHSLVRYVHTPEYSSRSSSSGSDREQSYVLPPQMFGELPFDRQSALIDWHDTCGGSEYLPKDVLSIVLDYVGEAVNIIDSELSDAEKRIIQTFDAAFAGVSGVPALRLVYQSTSTEIRSSTRFVEHRFQLFPPPPPKSAETTVAAPAATVTDGPDALETAADVPSGLDFTLTFENTIAGGELADCSIHVSCVYHTRKLANLTAANHSHRLLWLFGDRVVSSGDDTPWALLTSALRIEAGATDAFVRALIGWTSPAAHASAIAAVVARLNRLQK